jgi:hypothetical protein
MIIYLNRAKIAPRIWLLAPFIMARWGRGGFKEEVLPRRFESPPYTALT